MYVLNSDSKRNMRLYFFFSSDVPINACSECPITETNAAVSFLDRFPNSKKSASNAMSRLSAIFSIVSFVSASTIIGLLKADNAPEKKGLALLFFSKWRLLIAVNVSVISVITLSGVFPSIAGVYRDILAIVVTLPPSMPLMLNSGLSEFKAAIRFCAIKYSVRWAKKSLSNSSFEL